MTNLFEETAKKELPKPKIENIDTEKEIEVIYGISERELVSLLERKGYLKESLKADDPDFEKKYEEFLESMRKYHQARVKLFDRVLLEEATEEEMKIAENHATQIAKLFGLSGFHSVVPKSWYTNERLSNAMAATSAYNKEWVDYVLKYYTKEKLLKGGFEKIGEDGFAHTYYKEGY